MIVAMGATFVAAQATDEHAGHFQWDGMSHEGVWGGFIGFTAAQAGTPLDDVLVVIGRRAGGGGVRDGLRRRLLFVGELGLFQSGRVDSTVPERDDFFFAISSHFRAATAFVFQTAHAPATPVESARIIPANVMTPAIILTPGSAGGVEEVLSVFWTVATEWTVQDVGVFHELFSTWSGGAPSDDSTAQPFLQRDKWRPTMAMLSNMAMVVA